MIGWKSARQKVQGPLLRRFTAPVQKDLLGNYTRNLHKWLVVAPIIGVLAGLAITAVAVIILRKMWPAVLGYYLQHHWAIVPGLVIGCALTALIMQYGTSNPNLHSTEEIIRSYHEHQGRVDLRSFPAKLLAAITTVGFGGSAALEGPSIYGGAAVGSWLWTRLHGLKRFRLEERDRRIMLICGAAAGMSAVFRAPLTGIVFALEMPYKDDLAHEALLPSLIASVVSYLTLGTIMGSEPLFNFLSSGSYNMRDLLWSALLGMLIGLAAMVFLITFRHFRALVLRLPAPHWIKLTLGGLLTALCALLFLQIYPGVLVPLGPNYEAVGNILNRAHSSQELVTFGIFKLAATTFTLGTGGVSAMFVPLFLTGGGLGVAFAQSVVHSASVDLYAYLIPALVGAAVAYAISGDASVSSDQQLHEVREASRAAQARLEDHAPGNLQGSPRDPAAIL